MQKSKVRAVGHKFDISEAILEERIKFYIFLHKSTSECFMVHKKGVNPQVAAAVLCVVTEKCAKWLPITCQTIYLKPQDIANVLGIEVKCCSALRGWCDQSTHYTGISLRWFNWQLFFSQVSMKQFMSYN